MLPIVLESSTSLPMICEGLARGCVILQEGSWSKSNFSWAHVSVQTTERYLGCKQKLRHAVNDRLGLEDI
jgi:hypothetical protein